MPETTARRTSRSPGGSALEQADALCAEIGASPRTADELIAAAAGVDASPDVGDLFDAVRAVISSATAEACVGG